MIPSEPWPGMLRARTDAEVGRTLLEHGPVAVTVVSREGWVVFCNPAASALLGRPGGPDVPAWRLTELIHPDDAPAFCRQLAAAQPQQAVTLPLVRVGGPQRPWVWLRASVLQGDPARRADAASPLEPETTVVWQEAAAQHQRTGAEARQILQETAQGRPLAELLNRIASMVRQHTPAHFGAVFLAESEERLALAAAPDAPPGFAALFPVWRANRLEDDPADNSLWGHAAGPLLPQLASALRIEAGGQPPLPSGVSGVTCLPLLDQDGRVLGALAVYARDGAALPPAVMELLAELRSLATLAVQHYVLLQRLQVQAERDVLTGLPDRALFSRRLRRQLATAQRCHCSVAVLFIDLDDFKAINDTLGPQVGDEVLRQVARRLAGYLTVHDILARMGGDEFAVILPFLKEPEAADLARRILQAFTAPLDELEPEVYVDLSIGVSVADPGAPNQPAAPELAHTLMRSADLALSQAKQQRTGYVVFGRDLSMRAQPGRLQLASALRQAAGQGELELHYQPQVRLSSGRLEGVEALLRWHHPTLGLVSPAQFIPVAEATGLIVSIGEWVLREACRQAAQWQQLGSPLRVAVNVSALQFAHSAFTATVADSLRESGLPPECLELELTERVIMTQVNESAARMARLRDLGVQVTVDDFGTGYSSLSHLSRLPLSGLKIDRSFVSGLTPDSSDFAVIQAINRLSHSLKLTTTAEGIETWSELALVQDLGCDLGQGYFLGRPLPAAPFEQHLGRPQGSGPQGFKRE